MDLISSTSMHVEITYFNNLMKINIYSGFSLNTPLLDVLTTTYQIIEQSCGQTRSY